MALQIFAILQRTYVSDIISETDNEDLYAKIQSNAYFSFASIYANVTLEKCFCKILGLSCRTELVPESTTLYG